MVVIALVEANKPTTSSKPNKINAPSTPQSGPFMHAHDDVVDDLETVPSKRKDTSDTSFLSKLFSKPLEESDGSSSAAGKKEEESVKNDTKSEKKESTLVEQDAKPKSGWFSKKKEEDPEAPSRDSTQKKKESTESLTKEESKHGKQFWKGFKEASEVPPPPKDDEKKDSKTTKNNDVKSAPKRFRKGFDKVSGVPEKLVESVETKPETRSWFQGTKKVAELAPKSRQAPKQVPKKVASPKKEESSVTKPAPKKPKPSKEASQKDDAGSFGLPNQFFSGKNDDKKEAPVEQSKPSWRDQRKPAKKMSRGLPFGLSSDKKKVATLDKGKKAKEIAKVKDDKSKQQNAENDIMLDDLKTIQRESRTLKRAQAQKEIRSNKSWFKRQREERELQQQQRKEAAAAKRKGRIKKAPEKDASDKNKEESDPESNEEVSREVETSDGDGTVNTTASATYGSESSQSSKEQSEKDASASSEVDNDDDESTTASQESTDATPSQNQQPSGIIVMGGPPNMGGSPRYIIRRQAMSPQRGGMPPQRGGMPLNAPPPSNTGAIIAEVTASLVATAMRLSFLTWLTRRLAAEEESMNPTQHFVWECINDRYTRDEKALGNALSRPPIGISAWAWKKYTKKLQPKKKSKVTLPNQTVVVVDITPNESLDLGYVSDVVTFLVGQHTKKAFGESLEVVLLVHSPGGAVSVYGLAASQIARLRDVGIETTVCVDKIAASGGYMMASQATRILAAPFAAVGSIGVVMETLNFNKILKNYGVQPLHLTAGEHKNLISTFGEVTDTGMKEQQKQLNQMHRAFIDFCISNRPDLNETVCDGSVLFGAEAQKVGMIDRVQTSDEYIWEKLREGDHVLMLHKNHGARERRKLLALDLLPHLKRIPKEKIRAYLTEAFKLTTVVGVILRTLKH
jgi:serine protease SohB